ncbi:hypothetical protein KUTeg_017483 [Tegillarca granosa]|uniref:KY-like immunoglobulin-like domain-containing protein n=1 Tax=Tegillarca granosa TaxID=220873 RepID=A0ABQ9EKI3_TEGGR|nr:hypothetical protein KUTeg_017483 [Tegillarca granosa]
MKDYWFMTDPEEFSTMCHPDNVKWQLLVQPYSRKQFSNLPFCKPEFFRLNMKIIEPTCGRVKSLNGRVSVEIAAPKSVASKLLIYHKLQGRMLLKPKNISLREVVPKLELSQDMDTEEQENVDHVEKVTSETEESIHFPDNLQRYVFMTRRETHVFFEVILPVAGSYLFNVHCALTSQDGTNSDLPIPLSSDGVPSFECSRYGLRPLSHRNGPVFMTPNEPVDIQFKINKELDFKVVLLHHVIPAEELKNHISHHVDDKILTVHASIPQDGRYALEIFAKSADEIEFKNVCNYLLIYDKSNPNLEVRLADYV